MNDTSVLLMTLVSVMSLKRHGGCTSSDEEGNCPTTSCHQTHLEEEKEH